MKKIFHFALLISFIVTLLVPLTGIHIHKLVSVIFLLLAFVHMILSRKKSGDHTVWLMALVVLSFATGLFGMILDQYPIILILHRVISIAVVFFCAIHIYRYRRKI